MQPYFLPYIGYFQLINFVDKFVVYDDIQFSKKGWINRNRILVNGKDSYITLPLKKDSDYLSVRDRWLSSTWESDRTKMLNRIWNSYNKSPCFNNVFSVIEKIILFDDCNLFDFILNSIIVVLNYLEINTPLVVSSTIPFDSELMSEKKVIDICKTMEANCLKTMEDRNVTGSPICYVTMEANCYVGALSFIVMIILKMPVLNYIFLEQAKSGINSSRMNLSLIFQ